MKIKNNFFAALALVTVFVANNALAQRVSTMSEQPTQTKVGDKTVISPAPAPAPATVKAKYEGGVVGYGKSEGTLNFDENQRLLFRDKTQKEMFSVPYSVINAAYADTQSRRSTAATTVASTVPYGLGLPALLLPKKKTQYLTLHYRDPDSQAEGIASFKLQNKELLASVLVTLANKAGLTQRGQAFVRRREPTTVRQVSEPMAVPVPSSPPGRP
jgi:hypothetical protein